MTIRIGVLAGVTVEGNLLRRRNEAKIPSSIRLSGAKRDRAEHQLHRFVAEGATHLLSFGFAGGIDPALPAGTVLLPQSINTLNGAIYPVSPTWHQAAMRLLQPLKPVDAPYLAVDDPVSGIEHKKRLFLEHRACAVDMESHIIASAGLPFLVLRAICDDAHSTLPPAAMASTREDGSTDILRLIAALCRRPSQIGDLIRLGAAANAAKSSLLGCCDRGLVSWFGVS